MQLERRKASVNPSEANTIQTESDWNASLCNAGHRGAEDSVCLKHELNQAQKVTRFLTLVELVTDASSIGDQPLPVRVDSVFRVCWRCVDVRVRCVR